MYCATVCSIRLDVDEFSTCPLVLASCTRITVSQLFASRAALVRVRSCKGLCLVVSYLATPLLCSHKLPDRCAEVIVFRASTVPRASCVGLHTTHTSVFKQTPTHTHTHPPFGPLVISHSVSVFVKRGARAWHTIDDCCFFLSSLVFA